MSSTSEEEKEERVKNIVLLCFISCVFILCFKCFLTNYCLLFVSFESNQRNNEQIKRKQNKQTNKQSSVFFHFRFFMFFDFHIWWTNHITSLVLKSKNETNLMFAIVWEDFFSLFIKIIKCAPFFSLFEQFLFIIFEETNVFQKKENRRRRGSVLLS